MSKPIQVNQGDRYGKLIIISESNKRVYTKRQVVRQFLCHCDCGSNIITSLNNLRKGKTKSCGCISGVMKSIANTTHGLSYHPLYKIWNSMKQRCYNHKDIGYHRYGGRGIKICNEWLNDFKQFYDDMISSYTPGLSIDRINNDGNYCKDNCRWATDKEQASNKTQCNGSTYKIKLDVTIKIIVER